MKENIKKQTPKRLPSSSCAEWVARPGRLPIHPEGVGAFLKRARKGSADVEPTRVMAAARFLHEQRWAEIAHAALLALQRIFGIKVGVSIVQAVNKGKMTAANRTNATGSPQAHCMLQTLLEFLASAGIDALAAQLILTSDGELKAGHESPNQPGVSKRLPDERPVDIWAKPTFIADHPIARLHR